MSEEGRQVASAPPFPCSGQLYSMVAAQGFLGVPAEPTWTREVFSEGGSRVHSVNAADLVDRLAARRSMARRT
jgi:hypothetical protein